MQRSAKFFDFRSERTLAEERTNLRKTLVRDSEVVQREVVLVCVFLAVVRSGLGFRAGVDDFHHRAVVIQRIAGAEFCDSGKNTFQCRRFRRGQFQP